jgi:hypothetical protein
LEHEETPNLFKIEEELGDILNVYKEMRDDDKYYPSKHVKQWFANKLEFLCYITAAELAKAQWRQQERRRKLPSATENMPAWSHFLKPGAPGVQVDTENEDLFRDAAVKQVIPPGGVVIAAKWRSKLDHAMALYVHQNSTASGVSVELLLVLSRCMLISIVS